MPGNSHNWSIFWRGNGSYYYFLDAVSGRKGGEMSQPPQGKSIWGTINTCVEIALDVYAIVAKDQDGKEQQGIMVKKSSAGELLSKKDWQPDGESSFLSAALLFLKSLTAHKPEYPVLRISEKYYR